MARYSTIRFVAVVREVFLNETQYLTPVLRGDDLRQAISRPAEAYFGEVEPNLVEAIVSDMGMGSS